MPEVRPVIHAEAAAVTYETLHAWRTARRNPGPENLAALADALEHRGGALTKLAQELRKEAG